MSRKTAILPVTLILAAGFLAAKDFWERPFTEWAQKDVNKMLQDSPWTLGQTFTGTAGGRNQASGISGEREIYDAYTIRLFSSQPVRDAYTRMIQLMNRYDAAEAAEKQRIDNLTRNVRTMDVSERIIVAMHFNSSLPDTNRNFKQYFDTQRAELLKQNVYLISNRLGRVELKEYFPPSPDGSGMKFIFPRAVNGQPVLQESDKELKFDMWVQPTNHKIFVTWKTKSLMYQGKLEY